MAPKLSGVYVVDESANFINTNAKTQKDILYLERDTGKYKLGNGERYTDVLYQTPSTNVSMDADVLEHIGKIVGSMFDGISFEPSIEKKSAFNKDFGTTEDTVAPGKHGHSVNDISDFKLPKAISFPEIPKGDILTDNGSFIPLPIDDIPSNTSNVPISSRWASIHEKTGMHMTPEIISLLHGPVVVMGGGIKVERQSLSIIFGTGYNDVCRGQHTHDDYAKIIHTHSDPISPTRLPAISKTERGAVPPAGSPTGKSLHDDGSWKYPQSISLVPLQSGVQLWVAPCDGTLLFVHALSSDVSSVVIHKNSTPISRVNTSSTKFHDVFTGRDDITVPFISGDIFQTSIPPGTRVDLGVILTR
jgi:hypothetical protein